MSCENLKRKIINTLVKKNPEMFYRISETDLTKALPKVKFLHKDNRTEDHGELETYVLNIQQLYEYKEFYVIFRAYETGDYSVDYYDHSIEDELEKPRSLKNQLKEYITVMKKDGWSYREYISNIESYNSLIKFFEVVYFPNGRDAFIKYIDSLDHFTRKS